MRDDESCYQAVKSRDGRFDGAFFVGVRTTGIYCRPSCPATTPKRENVAFYPSAAAAQGEGFRACKRCRPDSAPGSADWHFRGDVVARAMRLIGDGVIDREGVGGLADRLGYSSRQVRRQLTAEVGAGPVALARAQRAQSARVLLQTTELPVTEIAFASGFASVRQFNDTIKEIYALTPREVRGTGPGPAVTAAAGVPLRLPYRRPYAAGEIFDFLGRRALPGVEEITGERGARIYRRTLRLPHGPGFAAVHEEHGDRGWLDCVLQLSELRDLTAATQRIRRLFDLDADPAAVAAHFADDPVLGPLAAARPGLRAPGAADPHEAAVKAVLGQQITVEAARRLGGTLVEAYGERLPSSCGSLTTLFPATSVLAGADLEELGMPRSRRATIITLAAALDSGAVVLDPGADREKAERDLLALRGIGPWTAGYIRMRSLGDPDVLLSGDVALNQALARHPGARPDGWSPWGSYATHHLWNSL
ncbi:AlkA N-terminal domain-containing protein [Actinocorallia longicatena]|uniref:DNA-3-methyladenine glycosylase II n=1 Tax=Actinocorallia longicatena TaxID=111803 RepID=A0ABP6QND9_9ACTN